MIFNRSKKNNKMGFDCGDDDGICNTGLGLGLSYGNQGMRIDQNGLKSHNQDDNHHHHEKKLIRSFKLEPSLLTLGLASDVDNSSTNYHHNHHQIEVEKIDMNKSYDHHRHHHHQALDVHHHNRQTSSPNSALSNSFSNTRSSSVIKREKELVVVGYHEEMEVENKVRVNISDEDDEGSARKKLRLTKEQSALLEESFKEHSTLNPKQKQALARQLNLRPRQVEVWFQNRRARTKLKQTEVDCEYLKKCCETLTEENRRLNKELQELKALKLSPPPPPPPMYMQLPAATLSMCPSCERMGGGGGGADNSTKNSFTVAPKKPNFYNPFNQQHPSAAC